jgi:hypothetical protein
VLLEEAEMHFRKPFWGLNSGEFPEFEVEILRCVRGLCNNGISVSY